MLKYKNILFDLDGTLSDSSVGIFKAVEYAFPKHNMAVPEVEKLKTFIGPPLEISFANYFEGEEVWKVLDTFREYYNPIGQYENRVYDGIAEVLTELRNRGYKIYVATSKGETSAKEVLEKFNLAEKFDDIIGASLMDRVRSKSDVLRKLFNKIPLNKSETLLIGDTKYDCEGAQIAGIDCGVVTYGFGNEEDFLPYDPKFKVDTAYQILDYFK